MTHLRSKRLPSPGAGRDGRLGAAAAPGL